MNNQIKAKIYYEIFTGNVLTIISECQGNVLETTKEEDINLYTELKGKSINEIDFIELEYGTFSKVFNNVKSYSVNLETKTLECIYYTSEEINVIGNNLAEEQIINDRISTVSQYMYIDDNSIDILENSILEYEKNKILEGMM